MATNRTETDPVVGILERDPVLRSRLKPGAQWEMTVLGKPVLMEVDNQGCRPVVNQNPGGIKRLTVYGCSCTYGYAVSAQDTFCSLLQAVLDGWRVENHGVPGYGTTQNLLQLQRNNRWEPAHFVTFCWIPDHLSRSVAAASWIQRLVKTKGSGPKGCLPKASIDDEGNLKLGYISLPRWDLVGLDLSDFDHDTYYVGLVSLLLFRRASDLVRNDGGNFFVTVLLGEMPEILRDGLRHYRIDVVNASVAGVEYTCMPDDHHPSSLAHCWYAEQIRQYLVHEHECRAMEEGLVIPLIPACGS